MEKAYSDLRLGFGPRNEIKIFKDLPSADLGCASTRY
jgi:hypothetical protein